jgi:hypothetical protein
MKKITLFLGGLFMAALVNAQAPVVPAEAAKPEISTVLDIKQSNHDFGKIPYGKAVEFDVEIKNLSADSIKIENVKVGCGCTTPRYQPGPYAPGESFKVTLGFNGYTEGHFEKTADIFFSNGLSQQIRFHGEGYKVPEASAPANGAVQKMKS